MTPEEAQIIRDIFDRIRQMGPAPRDPAADEALKRELGANPDAVMGLVRAVVALDRERAGLIEEREDLYRQIDELQQHGGPGPQGGGGLFGGGLFGGGGRPPQPQPQPEPARPWGSPPWGGGNQGTRGPWSSGDSYQPQQPPPLPGQQRPGGGMLGTALGAAAGVAGGLFAFEAMKGLFGGEGHGAQAGSTLFGSSSELVDKAHAQPFDVSSTEFTTGGDMDDGFFDGDDSSFG
jgi:hypothetical protein